MWEVLVNFCIRLSWPSRCIRSIKNIELNILILMSSGMPIWMLVKDLRLNFVYKCTKIVIEIIILISASSSSFNHSYINVKYTYSLIACKKNIKKRNEREFLTNVFHFYTQHFYCFHKRKIKI